LRKHSRTTLILFALSATASLLWLSTPAPLANNATTPTLPANLDSYIADQEHIEEASHELFSGTEKRIRWQNEDIKTQYAVVYLPGFSATRQEIAPTAELVADALDANLFETRWAGHGRVQNAMVGVSAEDWLDDTAEALAIAARLGEQTVIISTSTGSTLALAMVGHPAMKNVVSTVMISPNFAPQDPAAKWLTRPAGPQLARLIVGETRSWEPTNDEQDRYWSNNYPMSTMVEVMRLVDYTQSKLPFKLDQSILTFISLEDTVVSPQATLQALEQIESNRQLLIKVDKVGDPGKHVLAGRILSPKNTATIAAQIVEFIQQNANHRINP
jgi:esterase/lipase